MTELKELSGFDLFRYFRARQNGLSEDESMEAVRAHALEPERETTQFFDIYWTDFGDARTRTVAAVSRWFATHAASGRFFVDDDGICAEVRCAFAPAFVPELMDIARELDALDAIAFVDDTGEISCMAFGDTVRRRTKRFEIG